MIKPLFALLLLSLIAISDIAAQTYNYYYGNIHAHSSYSDGNKDSNSSNLTTPYQDFIYAKASQHIDFYGISEHNHKSAGMTNTKNYHKGISDADSATIDGSFVALYGMEWGVISSGGHVIIYGYDSLIGWDEYDYDVFVDEADYTNLWKKINERPGSFAYLAHPQNGDYNNLLSNGVKLDADNAIIGMAGRSGPAFSTNTSYSNPASGDYISSYNNALKRGYHVGIGLDHDSHNSVFGRQTDGRLVVLATSLTHEGILEAFRQMRFYCSDDWNVKVNFKISSRPMGSIITQVGSPNLNVTITDADAENVSSIAVYYGVPGSGSNPTTLTSVSGSSTLNYTHTISNNSTYYYYLKITQTDGDIIWTSPIWYTRNDAITNSAPTADFALSTASVCINQPVTFTDKTTNAPLSWSWSATGALPATSAHQSFTAVYNTPGTYTVTLDASNTYGSSSVTKTITVKPDPAVTLQPITICRGETDTLVASDASSYSWSSGETSSSILVSPFYTTNYTVTATENGCSRQFTVWVTVNICAGTKELSDNLIKIYPNPANDFLIVDAAELPGEKTIKMYDIRGNLVLSKSDTENNLTIDLNKFQNGNYILKVITPEGLYTTEQFVIESK